ncbi:MAG TPA: decaprenyl-phosphate phosphoribosyltransferase [Gemmatimonadaceae bacterium]|nr:decaprenyl-phosphate phosphoribosyltransferase [Gemmatimonadaceae bacterium]
MSANPLSPPETIAPLAPSVAPAAAEGAPRALPRPAQTLRDWVRLVRPSHWVKNFFVLAPLLFSGRATQADEIARALGAFVMFCMLASAIYLWNDAADAPKDRAHPTKRARPIAAGRIAPAHAAVVGAILVLAATSLAWVITPRLAGLAIAYFVLNVAYTFLLKEQVLLDVFSLAAFFLIRLLAGCVAIGVQPSVWLLLCGGLLALYLGFTKRRHELTLLGAGSAEHRSVLSHYSVAYLDQMSGVLLAVTVVSYIMYTLTSDTAKHVGDDALAYSTAFVLYGVFRYLYLVHQRNGGSPTKTLLTDRALIATVLLWVAYCGWVIYYR